MSASPIVVVERLSYSVTNGSWFGAGPRKQILRDVSFEVGENEILALIGASGSGKTTIARCVAGLQKPEGGSIRFRQSTLSGSRREIQMVFQGGGLSLDPTMNIRESVAEGVWSANPGFSGFEQRNQAEEFLQMVGIPSGAGDRVPGKLSGGERQRVALARSLAARPNLLILDEPTSALDVMTAAAFIDLVVRLQAQQKFSILYITHDVPLALRVCHRVAVLHDGSIVEQGPASEILRVPAHSFTRRLLTDCALFPPT